MSVGSLWLDNFVDEEGVACPRVQIYNDGTGLVIEYPWYSSEGGDDSGAGGGVFERAISKLAATVGHMVPHARLGFDLAIFGGVVCGSLAGLMAGGGSLSLGGAIGAAVKNGFLAGVF